MTGPTHWLSSIYTDAAAANATSALTYRRNVPGLYVTAERCFVPDKAYFAQKRCVERAVAEVLRTAHGVGPIGSDEARAALKVQVDALVAIARELPARA